jgi:hypothetical protein
MPSTPTEAHMSMIARKSLESKVPEIGRMVAMLCRTRVFVKENAVQ